MRVLASVIVALASVGGLGCPSKPPASQLPSAQAAVDRMRATNACGTGVQADAKLDYFSSDSGRIRTELLMIASRPARLRMDVLVTGAGSVATLTSDGTTFAATDKRESRFLFGPASACNIARITHLPVPGYVLVTLLRGQAPVLKHDEAGLPAPTITWDGGYYVVKIWGNHDAVEEIHLVPNTEDWNKPWAEQRMRVLDVSVSQKGVLLYHAELDTHEPAPMSKATTVSPADLVLGITPIPPSGPECTAEIPRRIHVEMPSVGADVLFRYDKVEWNPPLQQGVFTQQQQPGFRPERVECTD